MKLLFVAKGSQDSGNYITINRIRQNLELKHLSWKTYLFNIESSDSIINEFSNYLRETNPDIIIGLNLIRCLFFLKVTLQKTPLVMILGGTDINNDHETLELKLLTQLIEGCKFIVAFSMEMKETFRRLFPQFNKRNFVKIISQGIDIAPDLFGDNEDIKLFNFPNENYFLVVGRLRNVKNPQSIVMPFQNWWNRHRTNQMYQLIYIGSIEENSLEIQNFIQNIKEYSYINHYESLPHNTVLKCMKSAVALVNCSKHEGQCTTILEAMKLHIPVIASNVVGNQSYIKHNDNGMLYSTDEEFIECLDYIKEKKNSIKLINNAFKYVTENHCPRIETNLYTAIIKKCLNK